MKSGDGSSVVTDAELADTVRGKQTLRDDLWAVTTKELNAAHAELEQWKRALSDTRGAASTCLALSPTKEQMRRTLARIAGNE